MRVPDTAALQKLAGLLTAANTPFYHQIVRNERLVELWIRPAHESGDRVRL
jgi:hypothetical protein